MLPWLLGAALLLALLGWALAVHRHRAAYKADMGRVLELADALAVPEPTEAEAQETIDRAARALFEAWARTAGGRYQEWEDLPETYHEMWRNRVRAMADAL
jgi:hypothetical protein